MRWLTKKGKLFREKYITVGGTDEAEYTRVVK